MDVDGDWIGVDRDGDVDRNAKWRLQIGMEMERNDRDLKLEKCYICNFSGSEFLFWINFSFFRKFKGSRFCHFNCENSFSKPKYKDFKNN